MNWLHNDDARSNHAANDVLRRWQTSTLQRCKRIYDALHLRRNCPGQPHATTHPDKPILKL